VDTKTGQSVGKTIILFEKRIGFLADADGMDKGYRESTISS